MTRKQRNIQSRRAEQERRERREQRAAEETVPQPSTLVDAARAAGRVVVGLLLTAALLVAIANALVLKDSVGLVVASSSASELEVDAIVVPGASVNADGTPSDMLKARLDAAVGLYLDGVADVIIVSGYDDGAYYSEAEVMQAYVVGQGVPADAVLCDHEGESTFETMCQVAEGFDVDSVVVVTQSYHLYRAVYDASSVGLDAVGVASDSATYEGQAWFSAREVMARCKDFVLAHVRPIAALMG